MTLTISCPLSFSVRMSSYRIADSTAAVVSPPPPPWFDGGGGPEGGGSRGGVGDGEAALASGSSLGRGGVLGRFRGRPSAAASATLRGVPSEGPIFGFGSPLTGGLGILHGCGASRPPPPASAGVAEGRFSGGGAVDAPHARNALPELGCFTGGPMSGRWGLGNGIFKGGGSPGPTTWARCGLAPVAGCLKGGGAPRFCFTPGGDGFCAGGGPTSAAPTLPLAFGIVFASP